MNTLESHSAINPYSKTDECAKFVIDDPTDPFKMAEILSVGQEYTLSFWIKSEAGGLLSISGKEIESSTDWVQHVLTFIAVNDDLLLTFATVDTYYIYHPQLEIGNKATDWRPAPEDAETAIAENTAAIAVNAQSISEKVSQITYDADKNATNQAIAETKEAVEEITPEYITNTVTTSTKYTSDMDGKLGSNDAAKAVKTQSGSTTLTDEDFTVSFNEKNVFSINENEAAFDVDVMKVGGSLHANVPNTQPAATITVVSGASIQDAIDNLGKFLLGNVIVYVDGQHAENVQIKGFCGPGIFSLRFNSGATLSGSIEVFNCSSVTINGPSQTACCIISTATDCVNVRSVNYFNIHQVFMKGSGTGYGVRADFCMANIDACNFAGFACGVEARYSAQVSMYNCIGGGDGDLALSTYAAWAHAGSMISVYGDTRPAGTLHDSNGWGLMRDCGATETSSSGETPVVQNTIILTPTSSAGCVTNTALGDGTMVRNWGYYVNPYQGLYSAAGGYMHGVWLYTDDYAAFYNTIKDATILTAILTVKRVDAYGIDGATMRLWYHGKLNSSELGKPSAILTDTGLTSVIDRGKSVVFTLTSELITLLQNGTIKGFGVSSAKSAKLMQLYGTVCDLTVVYES